MHGALSRYQIFGVLVGAVLTIGGCVGDQAGDPCAELSAHYQACTGEASPVGSCDPGSAESLLELSCEQLEGLNGAADTTLGSVFCRAFPAACEPSEPEYVLVRWTIRDGSTFDDFCDEALQSYSHELCAIMLHLTTGRENTDIVGDVNENREHNVQCTRYDGDTGESTFELLVERDELDGAAEPFVAGFHFYSLDLNNGHTAGPALAPLSTSDPDLTTCWDNDDDYLWMQWLEEPLPPRVEITADMTQIPLVTLENGDQFQLAETTSRNAEGEVRAYLFHLECIMSGGFFPYCQLINARP